MTRKDYKKIGKILNKQWFSNSLRFNNDFYIKFPDTAYKNIGSLMNPINFDDACLCHK